jgi:hypothetical protein
MRKEEIKEQAKNDFLEKDKLIFTSAYLLDENADEDKLDEVEEILKTLADGNFFYCQTVYRCPESHPAARISGLARSEKGLDPKSPPYCSMCEEYLTRADLEAEHQFALSEDIREELVGEDEE